MSIIGKIAKDFLEMEESNMVLEVVLIEFVGEKYSVFSFLHGERLEKEEIEKKAKELLEHLQDYNSLEKYWRDYFSTCPLEQLTVGENTLSRTLEKISQEVRNTKVIKDKKLNGFLVYLRAMGFNQEDFLLWFSPSKSIREHFKGYQQKNLELNLVSQQYRILKQNSLDWELL